MKKTNLQYHIAFETKERRPFFQEQTVKQKMAEVFFRIAQEQNVKIETLAIRPEHVHMRISTQPGFQLQRFMQFIRGKASYLIKKECPELKDLVSRTGLWSKSYFARTTGPVTSWKVDDYIQKQK